MLLTSRRIAGRREMVVPTDGVESASSTRRGVVLRYVALRCAALLRTEGLDQFVPQAWSDCQSSFSTAPIVSKPNSAFPAARWAAWISGTNLITHRNSAESQLELSKGILGKRIHPIHPANSRKLDFGFAALGRLRVGAWIFTYTVYQTN